MRQAGTESNQAKGTHGFDPHDTDTEIDPTENCRYVKREDFNYDDAEVILEFRHSYKITAP